MPLLFFRVSESLRLVLWSGGTWLFEVIGFIIARYISPPQERWYDYLWYIPATLNSLRGFGIFFILVMTPENRTKIYRALGCSNGMSNKCCNNNNANNNRKSTMADLNSRNMSMSMNSSVYNTRNYMGKKRNMSVATIVTNIPQFNQISNAEPPQNHARLVHSISQNMERRPSTTSSVSLGSENEDFENLDSLPPLNNTGNTNGNPNGSNTGGRRKSSVAPVALPSVDEEEDHQSMEEISLTIVPVSNGSPIGSSSSN